MTNIFIQSISWLGYILCSTGAFRDSGAGAGAGAGAGFGNF